MKYVWRQISWMGRKREEERDIFFDDLSAHLIWYKKGKYNIHMTYTLMQL
jgi:hypothetical protein